MPKDKNKEARFSLSPHLPFLLFSICLAVVIGLTIRHAQTGKGEINSRDPLLLWPTLGWLIVFEGVWFLSRRASKCYICGQRTADELVSANRKSRRLCREHLLARFREEFVTFPHPMVVFYPKLEGRTGPCVYQFQPISSVPAKQHVARPPDMCCRECVVEEIIESLRRFEGDFSNGVVPPYKGKGFLTPGMV